jgi:hypothetical protein
MSDGDGGEGADGADPDSAPSAGATEETDDQRVVLRLPEAIRAEFKDPLGPVSTDAEALLAEAGDPLLAVGDIVTYHLVEAGRRPHLAAVDGLTERGPTDEAVRELLADGDRTVWNPAARLTADALAAVREALDAEEPTTLVVEGEEDLLTLPVILAAPTGASVVYGQPGEGMVHVRVDASTRERARTLFERLTGDHERARALLGLADGDGDGD